MLSNFTPYCFLRRRLTAQVNRNFILCYTCSKLTQTCPPFDYLRIIGAKNLKQRSPNVPLLSTYAQLESQPVTIEKVYIHSFTVTMN